MWHFVYKTRYFPTFGHQDSKTLSAFPFRLSANLAAQETQKHNQAFRPRTSFAHNKWLVYISLEQKTRALLRNSRENSPASEIELEIESGQPYPVPSAFPFFAKALFVKNNKINQAIIFDYVKKKNYRLPLDIGGKFIITCKNLP